MKMIDIHSHWGTKRGYVLRTDEELAQQKKTWNSEPKYATEDQMADYFRRSNVRAVLDFGFTKFIPLDEARAVHDYGFETERAQGAAHGPSRLCAGERDGRLRRTGIRALARPTHREDVSWSGTLKHEDDRHPFPLGNQARIRATHR